MIPPPPEPDAALADALRPRLSDPLWVVAFSGGLDSTALLIAASRFASRTAGAPPLVAVHVNHRLHPDADAWERHCLDKCKEMHIECRARRIEIDRDGHGLEAAARRSRYAVFRDMLGDGGSLLLGHHLDDQVETFFLRLMRGAGVNGLAGMPAERVLGNGTLLRPFIRLPRDRLREYAAALQSEWLEDSSNADTRYDRNYLRHAVMPLLARRWPGYRAPVARAMDHLGDLAVCGQSPLPPTRYNAFGDPGCDATLLSSLPPARAASALRHWLRAHSCQAPPQQPLLEFLRQLRDASTAASPRLQRRDWCLQRYGDTVYLLPRPWRFRAPPPRVVHPGDSLDVPGVGRIVVSRSGSTETPLKLGFRRGGERIRLPGETYHRSLKTLLQAAGVPPWWRERLPLLFAGEELLAAGDFWRSQGAGETLAWKPASASPSD